MRLRIYRTRLGQTTRDCFSAGRLSQAIQSSVNRAFFALREGKRREAFFELEGAIPQARRAQELVPRAQDGLFDFIFAAREAATAIEANLSGAEQERRADVAARSAAAAADDLRKVCA